MQTTSPEEFHQSLISDVLVQLLIQPQTYSSALEMDEERMPSSALKEFVENPSPGISVYSSFVLSLPFRYSWLGEKRGLHLMGPL